MTHNDHERRQPDLIDVPHILIRDWLHLNEVLFDGWNDSLKRFRSPYAFRGLSCAGYDLRSSLDRLCGHSPQVAELERHLLRNFKKYASTIHQSAHSEWRWLALGQHHGLPTRLTDWTYSPYVAMHFAVSNPEFFQEDGAIWCVDFTQTNQLLPVCLRTLLEEEGASLFTVDMLDRVADNLGKLDGLAQEPFVLFFEPPSIDERIVNQFAFFALMSGPTVRLDDWLARQPRLCRKLILPAALKWEIRDKLDQANITERVLFPGPDGLCAWLKRYYTPTF